LLFERANAYIRAHRNLEEAKRITTTFTNVPMAISRKSTAKQSAPPSK